MEYDINDILESMVRDSTIVLPDPPKPLIQAQTNGKEYYKDHMIVHRPTKECKAPKRILIVKVDNNYMEITNTTHASINTQPFADHHVHTITPNPIAQSQMLKAQEREP